MDDERLRREIERLLIEYSYVWEGFEEEVFDLGDVLARWNGFWGFASRLRLKEEGIDRRLDDVIEQLEEGGRQYGWVIGPHSEPPDLAERFEARGFTHHHDWDGLVLDDLTRPISGNSEATIEELSEGNAEEYARFIVESTEGHMPHAEALGGAHRYLQLRPQQALISLARLDGRIAAYSILRIEPNGIAYLRQGTTLKEYQGRGLYTALVGHRIAIGREMGCRFAVVQSITRTSAPILKKLGFRRVCGLSAWGRPREKRPE